MGHMDKSQTFKMRVDEAWLSALDALRKNEADMPSRAAMVRRLVMRALTSNRKEPNK